MGLMSTEEQEEAAFRDGWLCRCGHMSINHSEDWSEVAVDWFKSYCHHCSCKRYKTATNLDYVLLKANGK